MEAVKRTYIVDEKNRKVAVQLDIKSFNQIEEIMENFALYKLMDENKDEETLDIKSAKKYYSKLKKSNWELNIEKDSWRTFQRFP